MAQMLRNTKRMDEAIEEITGSKRSHMQVHYRSRNGRLTFAVEAGNPKEAFESIANLQDVFETEDACGLCKSSDTRFRVREAKGSKYYELRCAASNAQFRFGQNRRAAGCSLSALTPTANPYLIAAGSNGSPERNMLRNFHCCDPPLGWARSTAASGSDQCG